MEHETKLYSCLFWKGLHLTTPLDYLNLKSLHFWCRHPVAGWHFGCGTRWHNVAGVWVSLQLKRLPRWLSTKPCYQPTPYLRQDVRRHKIPWTCWTCAFPLPTCRRHVIQRTRWKWTSLAAHLWYPGHVLGTKEHGTTSFLVLATHTPRLLLDLQFAWPYQDHHGHTKTLPH